MKKKLLIVIIVLTLVVGWGIHHYRSKNSPAGLEPVWVTAKKAEIGRLPAETSAIGTLVARSVEITPEVSGHVEKILFQDGTFVKKGTPLIQLDDAIQRAKYQSAQAQLIYSESNFKRATLLGKLGAIARQSIDQAQADLKEKRAIADESKVMVEKMLLTAPFDGVVGKSQINPGDYVAMSQKLVTITDTKHLRVEYNVPEKYFPALQLGQAVNITTAAYNVTQFDGKVAFISPTINIENRSVAIYAEVPNEDNKLSPGMFVNVRHSLGKDEEALLIPARSLVPMLDGEQVYKIVEGKAYSVSVLLGKRLPNKVQILQGLKPGDMVITDGQLKLRDGVPVKIKT